MMTCWIPLAFLTAAAAVPETRPAGPPNFLFVLIDDMGFGDLGCFGGTRAPTPAIDRLAGEGLRFRQFYVNAPICSPSRVAFTTGQYPTRWRITSYLAMRREDRERGIADWLDPDAPSLARILAGAGYHTAHVGKWHMGGQRDVGDAPPITAYGFATSLTNFEGLGERLLPVFPSRGGRPLEHGPTRMSAELGGPIRWVDRHQVTAGFVDRAIEEIRSAQGQGKPFYINLWPDDVHSPVEPAPEHRGDNSPVARYAAVLTELDRQLGRIFEMIQSEPRLRENTWILIASDNGPEEGLGVTGGLRGAKGNLYEGGIRSPLIAWSARQPSAARGTVDEQSLLAAMDFPPTLLALAGVAAPEGVTFDGLDRSDALLARRLPRRPAPVMWVRPPDRPGPRGAWPDLAIREGRWKLCLERDGSRAELYDIPADPGESRNIAGEHPDGVERLSRRLLDWAADQNQIAEPPQPAPRPRRR